MEYVLQLFRGACEKGEKLLVNSDTMDRILDYRASGPFSNDSFVANSETDYYLLNKGLIRIYDDSRDNLSYEWNWDNSLDIHYWAADERGIDTPDSK